MEIVFHIGVHCTDDDRLVKSLLKNRDVLADHGVAVPGPGRYRRQIGEIVAGLRGDPSTDGSERALIEEILDDETAHRIILSNESFISMVSRTVEDGILYPRAFKSGWLRNTFPNASVEFAMGLRNPATFLPAIYERRKDPEMSFEEFLGGMDLDQIYWSEVIERLQASAKGARFTVWCDEDTPLLWGEIMREVTRLDISTPLDGGLDIARSILTREGGEKLTAFLDNHPPANELQRRRQVAAFLSKFAQPDLLEVEIDLPPLSEEKIAQMTAAYDEDVERIAHMPGVTLLTP